MLTEHALDMYMQRHFLNYKECTLAKILTTESKPR
jgi:hypothetical protein